jgi:RimJ/RimL family protein N-acetyltransferase
MFPILNDFPDAFETQRLLIRAPRPGDGLELNTAIRETFEDLKPWMAWATAIPSVQENEARLREAAAEFAKRTNLWLLAFHKDSGKLALSSGLHDIDWAVPRFETGYWCRSGFQGQGYVSEAVRGITVFCFELLQAKRLSIRCDARNERSRRVAERAGFRYEGTLRNAELATDGSLRDTMWYSLIPEDYRVLDLPPITW